MSYVHGLLANWAPHFQGPNLPQRKSGCLWHDLPLFSLWQIVPQQVGPPQVSPRQVGPWQYGAQVKFHFVNVLFLTVHVFSLVFDNIQSLEV